MSFYGKYTGMGGGGGAGGVTSLDGLTGALTLVAGTGISIVDGATTITISSTSAGDVTLTAFGSTPNANAASLTGQALTLQPADATNPGGVSITTQSFAGNKTFTGTIGASNLSGTNTGDVTIGTANGLSLVGQVLSLALSSTSTTGALSSTDWNTFNNKQATLTLTNLTDAGTDGIVITNGTGAVVGASPVTIAQHVADSTHNGYLSSADWSTFNGKQAAGNYITALTGDATASGPGSVALTLATVNGNVGTFASVTVNAKGLVTAATALSGDATTSGAALTLATVNGNVGSFGSATAASTFTVNAKGLITAAGSTSIQITESQVTNLTSDLAAKQSTTLTSAHILVGNVSNVATDVAMTGDISITNAGVTAYAGTVPLNKGGTGQTTKAPAFDALSPMTTGGDLIYGGASGTGTRLANGTAGQVVQSSGTTVAPTWASSIGPTTGLQHTGTNTNDNAASGFVGEYITANASGINFAGSGAYANVASVSLTAGDWDIEGFSVMNAGTATGISTYIGGVSLSNGGLDVANAGGFNQISLAVGAILGQTVIPSGTRRFSLSATTSVFLLGFVVYTTAGTGSWTTNSFIRARRVR